MLASWRTGGHLRLRTTGLSFSLFQAPVLGLALTLAVALSCSLCGCKIPGDPGQSRRSDTPASPLAGWVPQTDQSLNPRMGQLQGVQGWPPTSRAWTHAACRVALGGCKAR